MTSKKRFFLVLAFCWLALNSSIAINDHIWGIWLGNGPDSKLGVLALYWMEKEIILGLWNMGNAPNDGKGCNYAIVWDKQDGVWFFKNPTGNRHGVIVER